MKARGGIGFGSALSLGIAAALILSGVTSGPARAGTRARGAGSRWVVEDYGLEGAS
jgi:hypothetical protein